jgi:lysozyme
MKTKMTTIAAVNEAAKLIRKYEGCKLQAYRCPAGIWTIGYGHTAGVKAGDVWTQAQAEDALMKEIEEYGKGVLQVCPSLEHSPNRLAACISLAYNIGVANFAGSSVAKYIRRGEYRAAADAFGMWVYAGKQKLLGLVNRRQAERTVFRRDET